MNQLKIDATSIGSVDIIEPEKTVKHKNGFLEIILNELPSLEDWRINVYKAEDHFADPENPTEKEINALASLIDNMIGANMITVAHATIFIDDNPDSGFDEAVAHEMGALRKAIQNPTLEYIW